MQIFSLFTGPVVTLWSAACSGDSRRGDENLGALGIHREDAGSLADQFQY